MATGLPHLVVVDSTGYENHADDEPMYDTPEKVRQGFDHLMQVLDSGNLHFVRIEVGGLPVAISTSAILSLRLQVGGR